MMRKILYLLLLSVSLGMQARHESADGVACMLRDCDLLFQIAGTSNAITDVTDGVGSLNIEHVGVYACIDGRRVVVEALPRRGVCVTPLDTFLSRNVSEDKKPLVVVGRVTGDVDRSRSMANVLGFVGCDYDSLYLPDNKEIYCSELVQKSFVTHGNAPVFTTVPMTYRNSEGEIPVYWTEFYARHGMKVPEGEPGTNPGELSRRENVRIIFPFK
ncbi:MAG: hypothetical protein NC344_03405 [Bacteroidales bacterium]|nr:hypothetical protein [Bacteroidales bacterium]MCM1146877.1 hypothetical protein [Bacteroidales bacterium]MCM1205625.1 hypothetical protein [Bacillota bacterium]MCM1510264.1 hypothetical protein [Clostridium sp.]